MRIKGYRFECETCHNFASIQVFYRKDGRVGYSRARYYGSDKKFYYHQQTLEYVNTKLRELCNIDHGQDVKDRSIDQTKPESSPITKTMAGGEGFEPSTPNLGGWCSLRGNIKTKRDPPLCREFSYPC
jgi:hypothetical protein